MENPNKTAVVEGERTKLGKVKPKCEETIGQWVCVTHPKIILQNNMQMWAHTSDGTHRVAWRCATHGIEAP